MTTSIPGGISDLPRRNASRTSRLTRFLATAVLTFFFEIEIPSLAWARPFSTA